MPSQVCPYCGKVISAKKWRRHKERCDHRFERGSPRQQLKEQRRLELDELRRYVITHQDEVKAAITATGVKIGDEEDDSEKKEEDGDAMEDVESSTPEC